MRYSSRRKKQIALPLSKPTSEYNIKPRKKQKKQTQNKYIIKKKNTYSYICMFMFGIKQPKPKSLKVDIWTYQFPGFYIAR